jgi:hypothetical protein
MRLQSKIALCISTVFKSGTAPLMSTTSGVSAAVSNFDLEPHLRFDSR